GGTPTQHHQLRTFLVVDLGGRDVGGDAGDLGGAQARHALVVDRVVGDVAGAVLLLEAADAVLEAGRAGHGPRPGERLLVAQVGPELVGAVGPGALAVGLGGERHADVGQLVDGGQLPRLRPVGQIAVGQQQHGRAVL